MLLLVGLGNPGPGHAKNRHNIGFMAVDAIARRHGFTAFRERFHGLVAEGRVGGDKILALKPMTYMNESGRAVAAAARFFRVDPGDILVAHDEIDLRPGKVRVKLGGGHAGHNGLRSLHAHIGEGYKRLRLGVGHPGRKDLVTAYVLKDFAKADAAWLGPLLDAVAEAFPLLAGGDDSAFMSRVAQLAPPPEAETEDAEKDGEPGDGL